MVAELYCSGLQEERKKISSRFRLSAFTLDLLQQSCTGENVSKGDEKTVLKALRFWSGRDVSESVCVDLVYCLIWLRGTQTI
jgi:hypothetical protein